MRAGQGTSPCHLGRTVTAEVGPGILRDGWDLGCCLLPLTERSLLCARWASWTVGGSRRWTSSATSTEAACWTTPSWWVLPASAPRASPPETPKSKYRANGRSRGGATSRGRCREDWAWGGRGHRCPYRGGRSREDLCPHRALGGQVWLRNEPAQEPAVPHPLSEHFPARVHIHLPTAGNRISHPEAGKCI